MRNGFYLIVAVTIFFLGCGQGSGPTNGANATSANLPMNTTNTVTVTAPVVPESQVANTSTDARFKTFTDGSSIVGKDVQPGTYRTRAASAGCSWTRLAGFSGNASDIIATSRAAGPAMVTIKPTDKGFQSQSCGLWTSDLSRITADASQPFGDGEFLVGTDIAPGTWKAELGPNCYWARLRAFGGETADIIANQSGIGIVTIAPDDKGFVTNGCGLWTKVP